MERLAARVRPSRESVRRAGGACLAAGDPRAAGASPSTPPARCPARRDPARSTPPRASGRARLILKPTAGRRPLTPPRSRRRSRRAGPGHDRPGGADRGDRSGRDRSTRRGERRDGPRHAGQSVGAPNKRRRSCGGRHRRRIHQRDADDMVRRLRARGPGRASQGAGRCGLGWIERRRGRVRAAERWRRGRKDPIWSLTYARAHPGVQVSGIPPRDECWPRPQARRSTNSRPLNRQIEHLRAPGFARLEWCRQAGVAERSTLRRISHLPPGRREEVEGGDTIEKTCRPRSAAPRQQKKRWWVAFEGRGLTRARRPFRGTRLSWGRPRRSLGYDCSKATKILRGLRRKEPAGDRLRLFNTAAAQTGQYGMVSDFV